MDDEQELIQVNMQLPASALDGLSRLTEQLRKLTSVLNGLGRGGGTSEEIVESGFFDLERFQTLQRQSEETARRSAQVKEASAQAVRSDMMEDIQEPESAGRELETGTDTSDQVDSFSLDETAELEVPVRTEGIAREETAEEIPVVRPVMEDQASEAKSVRMEPDSQIPEAEETWAQAEAAEVPLPAAQAEISADTESPLGAGIVVTAQPEPPASRWTNMTEELVTAGPAPLTAEAVSLAFQRDGRRYDNGFPLY